MELQQQNPDGTYQTVASTDAGSYYNSDSYGTEYAAGNTPVGPSLSDKLARGPLSALFTSKYNYDRLQYPADLGSSGKGHMVVFDVYDSRSTTIEEATTWITNTAKSIGDSIPSAPTSVADAATGTVKAVEGAVNNTTQAYEALTKPGGFANLGSKITSSISATGQSISSFLETKKDFVKSIYLYMPDTLDFTYSANWEKTDLIEAAKSAPIVGGLAKGINQVMDNRAAQLAMNKLGYAFNPQAQMLFDGIDFRTYNMSFVFTPRSVQEAEIVKEIIKTFRMYAAPTVVSEAAGFFFKPPGIFGVKFQSNGAANHNINQLTDSVLESVEVNYAPNGWSAHRDGKPVQTTINLSFKEIVLVDRTKISNGY